MDITNDEQIDAAHKATLDTFGTRDVLVNNAALLNLGGTRPQATTLETLDEDWTRIFGVNVFGTVKVIRRFIQPMIEKRRGSVINVVSSGLLNFSHGGGFTALRPYIREMPYMASKAAVATMGFYLAYEVQPDNVAVNMIMPGHSTHGRFVERMRARLAQGRLPGHRPVRPEHAVPIVQFPATRDASGVTGKLFDVITWNQEHGLGSYDDWLDYSFPPDIEEAFAHAEWVPSPVGGWHSAPG